MDIKQVLLLGALALMRTELSTGQYSAAVSISADGYRPVAYNVGNVPAYGTAIAGAYQPNGQYLQTASVVRPRRSINLRLLDESEADEEEFVEARSEVRRAVDENVYIGYVNPTQQFVRAPASKYGLPDGNSEGGDGSIGLEPFKSVPKPAAEYGPPAYSPPPLTAPYPPAVALAPEPASEYAPAPLFATTPDNETPLFSPPPLPPLPPPPPPPPPPPLPSKTLAPFQVPAEFGSPYLSPPPPPPPLSFPGFAPPPPPSTEYALSFAPAPDSDFYPPASAPAYEPPSFPPPSPSQPLLIPSYAPPPAPVSAYAQPSYFPTSQSAPYQPVRAPATEYELPSFSPTPPPPSTLPVIIPSFSPPPVPVSEYAPASAPGAQSAPYPPDSAPAPEFELSSSFSPSSAPPPSPDREYKLPALAPPPPAAPFQEYGLPSKSPSEAAFSTRVPPDSCFPPKSKPSHPIHVTHQTHLPHVGYTRPAKPAQAPQGYQTGKRRPPSRRPPGMPTVTAPAPPFLAPKGSSFANGIFVPAFMGRNPASAGAAFSPPVSGFVPPEGALLAPPAVAGNVILPSPRGPYYSRNYRYYYRG